MVGNRVRDKVGQKFGRWSVLSLDHVDKHQTSHWKCECECGTFSVIPCHKLTGGRSKSCGCLRIEITGDRSRTHGQSRGSKVYGIWKSMRQRCSNEKNQAYERYGGRGIFVCERWHDFSNFFADMGNPPDGKTLERIDNNNGYSPENCKWATMAEQALNTRSNNWIIIDGIKKTLSQWSLASGISRLTIYARLKYGWDYKKAVFHPLRKDIIAGLR